VSIPVEALKYRKWRCAEEGKKWRGKKEVGEKRDDENCRGFWE